MFHLRARHILCDEHDFTPSHAEKQAFSGCVTEKAFKHRAESGISEPTQRAKKRRAGSARPTECVSFWVNHKFYGMRMKATEK
ncbi:MAG: hypothetical protein IKP82_04290 [Oscillospiraceae bacterium]|nr:hypothetical protein [Oscillospiraceae bacterium]